MKLPKKLWITDTFCGVRGTCCGTVTFYRALVTNPDFFAAAPVVRC